MLGEPIPSAALLAPVDRQEVWAAGVTYVQSRIAREAESDPTGAAVFYARVYDAERPELFLKATAARVVGLGAPVRVRRGLVPPDSVGLRKGDIVRISAEALGTLTNPVTTRGAP
jgi:fumarylacetoacetate (FAA) hydrolase family protein